MKHNLHVHKSINYISSILLILVFAFASIGATSQSQAEQRSVSQIAISNYLVAQQNADLSDEEKIKAAIDAYFTTRYEGQKLLDQQDFSPLLDDNTLDWVKKEKDKREIELYIASMFDMKYVSYSYILDYDSIEIKNNKATVQLRENHEVVFESIAPEVSKLADLQHTFTLHKKKGAWVIYKDEYQDELSKQLSHMTKDEIKKQIDENHQKDLDRKSSAFFKSGNKVQAMILPNVAALVNRSYNGTAAASYADTYWSSYNTNWYKTNPGTDCASFVSQAMYAGEGKTPPDTSGMTTASGRSYNTDWYFVFNNPKGTQNGSGSLPWIRVQEQYDFIRGNTAKIGPYGYRVNDAGTTYCDIGVGGIAQLYNVNGTNIWDHEGMVVQINDCYTMSKVLVDAHTTNRYHYPLSNWASYNMRFIHISGWRGN